MNVAFFLIPKQDVIYLKINSTMRQAIEKMEFHRYSAIPLIDEQGCYQGTITEGDLLWKLKNTPGLEFHNTHTIRLTEVEQHIQNHPVSINARMEDLISRAVEQNFIPVVDDQQIFIGLVRRREILEFCSKALGKLESYEPNDM
ncbi:CBS domain-containing protein [Desulfitobacterium dichloroeliminans LMG P-21439]|uniref:CBS domain-containing protein n=1 Tax=Desulfitobacterium dichloroeliminans (strain LMG P-21439 / DCA1) TaxID=871963 RepID=L0FAP5_DESDL|nr:CBS domain-containing protein [Desulfitobacterium dichloroeliminans]AGA69731.1 CBS domain-containing protein [Desulfitobacterium dichloroeliminans LMG P-21439]